MKKILLSLMTAALAVVVAVGATSAYFSDTETSTGNRFEAGSINLEIDNTSYYNGAESPDTSWGLSDLTNQLFFDFEDVKPGDWGEDTVSIHVEENDAWACANITLTRSQENGMTDSEAEVDDTWGKWGGELDEELQFVFWADDGDNVWETDEDYLMGGTLADLPQEDGNPGVTYPLADSSVNVFGYYDDDTDAPEPLAGGDTPVYYIGKAWCFGELNVTRLDPGAHSPLTAGNVSCNGELVGNQSQTDQVRGDISFYAVQARHNDEFLCSSWPSQED